MVLLDAVAPAKSVSNSALIFTAHMRVQPGTTPFPWFPPADCDHCSKRLWPNATNVGPRNIPITPNASAPPNTPSITRIIGVEPPRLMSKGFTTLSSIPSITPHAIDVVRSHPNLREYLCDHPETRSAFFPTEAPLLPLCTRRLLRRTRLTVGRCIRLASLSLNLSKVPPCSETNSDRRLRRLSASTPSALHT